MATLDDLQIAAVGSRYRPSEQQEVLFLAHFHDLQVLHRDPLLSHVPCRSHPRQYPRRVGGCTNRAGRPMKHRSVRGAAATKVMPLHHTGEPLALAHAADVDALGGSEHGNLYRLAHLQVFIRLEPKLAEHSYRSHRGLLEMTLARLVGADLAPGLYQSDLDRIVAIPLLGLPLNHHARASPHHGERDDRAVLPEPLGDAELLANDSVGHDYSKIPWKDYLECSFPKALISTSTPAGRSNLISASTVWGVGSKMSSNRLCVRISNCSRDFLSTCGERRTVHLFFTVGSGIGPAIRAPVRLAVSTISCVD